MNILVMLMIIGGAIAQLGERLLCTQEVSGSIPLGSTNPNTSTLDSVFLFGFFKPLVL